MYRVIAIFVLSISFFIPAERINASQQDLLFVLDNSGSMKTHDPEFMTRTAVSDLVEGLSTDARVGIVIFDTKAAYAMPLASIEEEEFRNTVLASLNQLTYQGKDTNIPIAIEKALYELRENGREDATKSIIFMTDGFIDTGDTDKDNKLGEWLKNELTVEAKKSGIRIYSLAFTEDADFELIQTLAVKTGGSYYRAGNIGDLEKVFENIIQAVLAPQPEETAKVQEKTTTIVKEVVTTRKEGLSREVLIAAIVIVGLIILGIVAITMRSRGGNNKPYKNNSSGNGMGDQPDMPDAILEDLGSITDQNEIPINKKEMTIGRVSDDGETSVDIAIPQNTVSALHASIEFRDNSFYITDRRSTNKTYLNNDLLAPDVPKRLKSGDIVAFDKYTFKFIVREQTRETGTVLRPGAIGGTVMRQQGDEAAPAPEPPVGGGGDLPDKREAEDDDDATQVKGACEIHESFKATDVCPVCKKNFCNECMVEKDGKRICVQCADKMK